MSAARFPIECPACLTFDEHPADVTQPPRSWGLVNVTATCGSCGHKWTETDVECDTAPTADFDMAALVDTVAFLEMDPTDV